MALRTVIPKNLSDLPPKKLIKFRKDYRDELNNFQGWMHALAPRLAEEVTGIKNEIHVKAFADREVAPKVAALRQQLEAVRIDPSKEQQP